MTSERKARFTPQMQRTLDELRQTIQGRYPVATFRVDRALDEAKAIHLVGRVDIDDPDDVVDLVIDRVLEFQLDHGLPIHVIPIRPLSRAVADQIAQRHQVAG